MRDSDDLTELEKLRGTRFRINGMSIGRYLGMYDAEEEMILEEMKRAFPLPKTADESFKRYFTSTPMPGPNVFYEVTNKTR